MLAKSKRITKILKRSNKLRTILYKLYYMKVIMPYKTLHALYYALAESSIRYGIQVRGNACKSYINRLFKIQKIKRSKLKSPSRRGCVN